MILSRKLDTKELDGLYERAEKVLGKLFDPATIGVRGLDGAVTCKAVHETGGVNYDLDGMASTGSLDQDEEVVLPDALDWSLVEKRYKAVYADHTYGIPNVIGSIRTITRKRGPIDGWQVRARLQPEHYSEQAKQARMLAEIGLAAYSIGFGANDRGPPTAHEKTLYPKARSIVRKATVFELSVTAMPCNLDCGTALLQVPDGKAAVVGELVSKGLAPEWASKRFVRPARRVVVCRV